MYDTIKLEKGLYSITGKNFTEALEGLDPDSSYKGTELEGLDAFERQLKRFDIRISGKNSDKVEKFFLQNLLSCFRNMFAEQLNRGWMKLQLSVTFLPQFLMFTIWISRVF